MGPVCVVVVLVVVTIVTIVLVVVVRVVMIVVVVVVFGGSPTATKTLAEISTPATIIAEAMAR